jgi:hypothetical protein
MKTNGVDISDGVKRELEVDELKQGAQRELAAGVLKQAAQDLRRFHGATSKIERAIYFDAYRWLTVNEYSSPFSFLNVCQLLNLAPDNVRQDIAGDSSLGALGFWTRRCLRATSQLRTSFGHFFVNKRDSHAETGNMVFNNAPSASGACLHEHVN